MTDTNTSATFVPKARHLVILRCGDASLHPQWYATGTALPGADFDLLVSYYGSDPAFDEPRAVAVHRFAGSKWQGLADCLKMHAGAIATYDYVWLPDDDIACTIADINRLFRAAHRHGFALTQPSLTWNSYFSYPATIHNRSFLYRETNFVEVMVPCFSRAALACVQHTFAQYRSGWGLDFLWPQLVRPLGKVGILDEIQVWHTRPVGSAGSGVGIGDTVGSPQPITPRQELDTVLARHQLRYKIKLAGAQLRRARALPQPPSRTRLLYHSLMGSHPVRRSSMKMVGSHVKEHFEWWS